MIDLKTSPGCRNSMGLTCLAAFLLGAAPAFGFVGFSYTARDMLIGFRQSGGTEELVVDLGQATNFYHLTPGSVTRITNYSPDTLNYAFSDLGGVSWSVFSSVIAGQSDANQPAYTLWATRARTDTNLQTAVDMRQKSSRQSGAAQYMTSVGVEGAIYANSLTPDGITDTATSVVIPAGSSLGYFYEITATGDFNQTFLDGNIENTTANDFGSYPSCVVSDLYELQPAPSSTPVAGVFHGFFRFNSDGTMIYKAAYNSPPALTSISPTTGVPAGGTTVTLTGSGFTATNMIVEFGGILSTSVQYVNSTTITAVAPADVAGAVSVLVANSDGQYSALSGAFTYQAAVSAPPGISSITRSGGNVVIVSTNTANSSLSLYTSTNITAPRNSWISLNTNSVGADGRWTNTIAITRGEPQRYFLLAIP